MFYTSIASFYDKIFPYNKLKRTFIEQSFKKKLSGLNILDIGCGTGSFLVDLYDGSNKLFGVDYDSEMIQAAKHKAGKRTINFYDDDMLNINNIFEEDMFDIVTCFGNTIVHLKNTEQITDLFIKIRKILKPQGKFLFQILNYNYVISNNISELPLIENEFIKFERFYKPSEDERIKFNTVLSIKQNSRVVENEILLFPVSKQSLDNALSNSGFEKREYFSGFDSSPYNENKLPLTGFAS